MAWIKRFIWFQGKRHSKDTGAREFEAFLTHPGAKNEISASTQNQAKSALQFLYREVLEQQLPWLDKMTQAKGACATAGGADNRRFCLLLS